MRSRYVTVYIYQYPSDANSTMSLRRMAEIVSSESLIYKERFETSLTLNECLSYFIDNTKEYADLLGEVFCYRIVVRDSDSRVSFISRF